MWLVSRSQRKLCSKVGLQHVSRGHSLQKGRIDLLLISLALVGHDRWFRCISHKEFVFSLLLCILGSREVFVSDRRYINSRNIHLGGGGNYICLVHSTKGNSIDFVGSRNEKKTRF